MFLAFLQTTQIANICINGVFVQVKVWRRRWSKASQSWVGMLVLLGYGYRDEEYSMLMIKI